MLRRMLTPSLAAALFVAAPGLRADLIKISPFMPPASSAGTPAQNAPLEYMGWVQTADGILYRVVDPAKKTGIFLKVGEKDSNLDVVVKQHDDDRNTLTIEHGGQTLTLPEHEAKVVSGGAVAQMIPPPPMPIPGGGMSPAVTQSVVVNPTPADEQRRLEAVAAEVARRRALREQAAQAQQTQGGVTQPVMPMPPQQTRQDIQQAQQGQPMYPQNFVPPRQRANRQNR